MEGTGATGKQYFALRHKGKKVTIKDVDATMNVGDDVIVYADSHSTKRLICKVLKVRRCRKSIRTYTTYNVRLSYVSDEPD